MPDSVQTADGRGVTDDYHDAVGGDARWFSNLLRTPLHHSGKVSVGRTEFFQIQDVPYLPISALGRKKAAFENTTEWQVRPGFLAPSVLQTAKFHLQ